MGLGLTSTKNSRLMRLQRLLMGLPQAHISRNGIGQTFHRPIRASSAARSYTYLAFRCPRRDHRLTGALWKPKDISVPLKVSLTF